MPRNQPSRGRSCLPAAILLASIALAGQAAAEPPSSGADAALQLTIARAALAEGKQRMEEGRWREALEKLDVSVREDPGPEALLAMGRCQEKLGATASAWGTYQRAEERARALGDGERAAEAARRSAALDPRLTRVKVVVEAAEPDLRVSLDERHPLGPSAWGAALPVDPGAHTVSASAPGKRRVLAKVDLSTEGETRTVVVPALAPIPPIPPLPPPGERWQPPPKRDTLPYKLAGGLALTVAYTGGVVMLVDEKADATVREVGGGLALGSLGVASIWAAEGLSSAYRITQRQGLGITMMGTGVASVYTSLVAVCAAVCFGNGPDTVVLSRDTWIASAAFGLAVGPGLIAAGYFVMGKAPEERTARADGPKLTLAPLAGGGRTGVSLLGTF